jgi:hypothetical protein
MDGANTCEVDEEVAVVQVHLEVAHSQRQHVDFTFTVSPSALYTAAFPRSMDRPLSVTEEKPDWAGPLMNSAELPLRVVAAISPKYDSG